MIDMQKQEDFVFGVFSDGKIIFLLNRVKCNHLQADFVIRLLNLADGVLLPTQYFAYDYANKGSI